MILNTKPTKKVTVIFGTRPEAIKLAPVILALGNDPRYICRVCVTAQHRQMLDQVLDIFGIVPDRDLNLMRRNQSLAELTARAIKAIDGYLQEDEPDLILVQGDTTTVLAATLAAFYRHIPVGHVEAGLRTWNLQAPWPEEANRVLTSRIATLHFAPTKSNSENLIKEGVSTENIFITGNTVIDALFLALRTIETCPPYITGLPESLQPMPCSGNGKREKTGTDQRIVLVTGHRRENFGQGFENICRALSDLAERFPDVQFVYPVHLNPNVREPVMRILGRQTLRKSKKETTGGAPCAAGQPNIHLIEPLTYLPFVALMNKSFFILTDSGGVQEEAPSLGKPVLVMRDTTERPEAVKMGTVKLVGTAVSTIVEEASTLLNQKEAYKKMANAANPYGDGDASAKIIQQLNRYFDFPKEDKPEK